MKKMPLSQLWISTPSGSIRTISITTGKEGSVKFMANSDRSGR